MRALLLLGLIAALVPVQATKFVSPPDDTSKNNTLITYNVGDTVEIKWDADESSVDILVVQDWPLEGDETRYSQIAAYEKTGSFKWKVQIPSTFLVQTGEFTEANFVLSTPGKLDEWITDSRQFNLSRSSIPTPNPSDGDEDNNDDEPETTTSVITIPSATSTPTVSPTPSTSAAASEPFQLSSGAIAGISVGGTVLVMGLLGLLGFCLWRRRKNQKRSAPAELADMRKAPSYDDATELPVIGKPQSVHSPLDKGYKGYSTHEDQILPVYELPIDSSAPTVVSNPTISPQSRFASPESRFAEPRRTSTMAEDMDNRLPGEVFYGQSYGSR